MVILKDIAPPFDGIRHEQNNTEAHVKGDVIGSGTLFVAESHLTWRTESGQGFCLEYPAISLHAVSRDLTAYPHECLYLMVDSSLDADEPVQHDSSSESDGESDTGITEIRFVPEDKTALDHMYTAMSDCQILHPDPNESLSEEDEGYNLEDEEGGADGAREIDDGMVQDGTGQGFFQSPDNVVNLTPEEKATLHRLEAMLAAGQNATPSTQAINTQNGDANDEMDTGQFEDA